jgi:hypothetical protein
LDWSGVHPGGIKLISKGTNQRIKSNKIKREKKVKGF